MSTDIGLKFYYKNIGKYTTVSEMFSLSPVFATSRTSIAMVLEFAFNKSRRQY